MRNALIVDPADNVVVAIEPIKKGAAVEYSVEGETKTFTALDDITIYHKAACKDIRKGEPVIKYGQYIGIAARDIQTGEHVHVHNVISQKEHRNGGEQ